MHVVAVAHRAQHGALEHLVDALAAALGDVHGDVGVAQQLGLVDGLALVEGDADAGADGDLPADQGERRAQGGQDPLGEHPRRLEIRVLGQDGELVAAQPADGVVLAQAAAQPGPDLAQQPVPGAVTQAVVDHLEVVQVDEEHGHAAAVAARPASACRTRTRVVGGPPGGDQPRDGAPGMSASGSSLSRNQNQPRGASVSRYGSSPMRGKARSLSSAMTRWDATASSRTGSPSTSSAHCRTAPGSNKRRSRAP